MTPEQLAKATGANMALATKWLPFIESAMSEFGIDTPLRKAAFLAQIGHESGGLKWTREIWGPTAAQARYEVRQDLGNHEPGDGVRFLGRGLIQLTGRHNFSEASKALGVDLLANPTLLSDPDLASRSAAWFWKTHGLNELADFGDALQERICKRINGGLNGYPERLALYEAAKAAFA
jgi:putative chitinase